MSNMEDFVIENGVLTRYNGPGGDVVIPEGVIKIGSCAFSRCTKITGINIPKEVTKIDNSAFYGCNQLTDLTLPEGVTAIGREAFAECKKLSSICIPLTVTQIGMWAFSDCPLKELVIKGTPKIDAAAFSNDIDIQSLGLPIPCVIDDSV